MDYKTWWRGITKQQLKNAISFKMTQKEMLKLLKSKIVLLCVSNHPLRV